MQQDNQWCRVAGEWSRPKRRTESEDIEARGDCDDSGALNLCRRPHSGGYDGDNVRGGGSKDGGDCDYDADDYGDDDCGADDYGIGNYDVDD